jgi:hypothetical protein
MRVDQRLHLGQVVRLKWLDYGHRGSPYGKTSIDGLQVLFKIKFVEKSGVLGTALPF